MRSSRTRSLLVSAFVLALAGLGWLYLAPVQIGGSTRYVVTHGISMEPRIHAGDLVLVRPAGSYRVGEVVAYHSTLLHTLVLHRIVRVDHAHYVFKGDNNDFLDPTRPTRALLVGRMWLHISSGGVWLSWLHRPWLAAALLGAVTMFLLFGGSRRRRRRDRGRRGSAAGTRRPSPVSSPPGTTPGRPSSLHLLTAALAATVIFAALSVVAFVHPASERTSVNRPYTQQLSFGYRSRVPPGPVYPDGVVSTGDPVYVQIVHRIKLTASYRLTAAGMSSVHGTIRIRGTLSNTSGWTRSFWLGSATRFSGGRARASATISFARLESLASRISAQIGSAGSYTLAVVPLVKVAAQIAGEPLATRYSPTLSLSLGTPQYLSGTSAIAQPSTGSTGVAQHGLIQSATGKLTSSRATAATLAGVPVQTVRWIGLAALVLSILLTLLTAPAALSGSADPVERINSRYRHLIVPVESIPASPDHPPIDVSTIDALAQLAERSERLILHDHRDDADNYLIDDQGTLFRFRAPRPALNRNGSGGLNGVDSGGLNGAAATVADAAGATGVNGTATAHAAPVAGAGRATAVNGNGTSAPDVVTAAPSDPAAEAAAAILSSAAAKLNAAAARAAAPTPAVEAPGAPARAVRRRPDLLVVSGEPQRAIGAEPREPRVPSTHWSSRPEVRRAGFAIGPLALAFLTWRRVRARRRRRRGDDVEESAKRSWNTRNLPRR